MGELSEPDVRSNIVDREPRMLEEMFRPLHPHLE